MCSTEVISKDDFAATLNEALDNSLSLTFTPKGRSMLPLLNGVSDTVTLSQKPEKLKKYDVVLFRRRSTGQFVLHRIVSVCGDGTYTLVGDGQYFFESGVTDDDILALMTSFTRDGKQRSVSSFTYRLYAAGNLFIKYLYAFALRAYRYFFPRKGDKND